MRERWFPPAVNSAEAAREFLLEATSTLDVDHDAVVLAGTELAANAIIHARTDFCVRITPRRRAVRVGVIDSSAKWPHVRPINPRQEGGLGLHVVMRLASAWGAERIAEGKCVWFELLYGREAPLEPAPGLFSFEEPPSGPPAGG